MQWNVLRLGGRAGIDGSNQMGEFKDFMILQNFHKRGKIFRRSCLKANTTRIPGRLPAQ